ncbi:hypothetical protein GYMLUDRAFT_47092 [Collybiopsis luxurians FD-317 M1]|uniref:Cytochrome P450 n=1 Tax=Collybiopsis luxurians FD-317 M1 TaxID=944289 RepID=A0A0D0CMA4_9AGAR|nr:hypothetical protein GYMLUDRAFT_47092 [Collybiopsis luxurians FD-317 M1]
MFSTTNILSIILGVFALRIYGHLFRHPLSRFPGPLLAKCTVWYRAYYDIVGKGAWIRHLQTLHALYGPIIRVGPNELHFSDPRAHGEIYGSGSRFHKDPVLYGIFGTAPTVFNTLDPQEAAAMRNLLLSYLSRHAVMQREAVIRGKVLKLISRLKSFTLESGKVANLDQALPSASLDVLTALVFCQSFNVLDAPMFEHPFVYRRKPSMLNLWIMKYLPSQRIFALGAITRFMRRMNPGASAMENQIRIITNELDVTRKELDTSVQAESRTDIPLFNYLFRRIQELTTKPGKSAKTLRRLQDLLEPTRLVAEGLNIRFAGTDTVANACIVGIQYLLTHEEILGRLVEELGQAWPTDRDLSYEELEKLPYLTAVIKESLRLSHGVVTPMGRVVGPEEAVIMGERIPAGTIVGMSAIYVHLNSELFPEATRFDPERWLNRPSRTETTTEINSDKYLVSFGRGPRSCVGFHLAWCELYLIFGYLFRKLELELANEQDPDGHLDFDDSFTPVFNGCPPLVFVKERDL